MDFKYAHELGYVVKLLATSSSIGGEVRARVHPAFLPEHNPLSKVDGVYNAVELEGDLISWAMFQGPGAGSQPTASAILGDVAAIAQRIACGVPAATHPPLTKELTVLPMADLETKYYLRVRAFDRPGVMAKITSVLGEKQVSLASVIQKEVGEGDAAAEIVITTHKAKEHAVQEAVRKLEALDVVFEVASLVRIEDGTA